MDFKGELCSERNATQRNATQRNSTIIFNARLYYTPRTADQHNGGGLYANRTIIIQ